jgi:hypothetical protein
VNHDGGLDKMHIINKPFTARAGQFCERPCSAVGIDYNALISNQPIYKFRLRGGDTTFWCYTEDAIRYAHSHNSIWTNKKNKRVVILPLMFFKQGVLKNGGNRVQNNTKESQ